MEVKIPPKAQYIADNIVVPYRTLPGCSVIWQLSLYGLIYWGTNDVHKGNSAMMPHITIQSLC
jgi:hypothetical protein